MVENTLDVRLLHAAKTLDNWNNITTIPKLGEVCLEIQGNTPPLNYKIKVGDGSSTYAALPYFGTVVNTSGNASVVVVDTVTDGSVTKKVLKFYKLTLTTSTVNGVTTITPTIGDLILTVQEGAGINFSTNTTDTLVNVELETTTADTAQTIADGGTFTTITKDSNNRATKHTTFTLPSIANSINALDVVDNTVITAEWDNTDKQIKLYYVKETDGIIQKGSLAYTINTTDIAPVQNITTTDTGNSGLEITTNNNIKDVHHKAVTQNVVDNSSVIGEKELNVITNVEVDSYGHITGYTKDKSTNLVAADIKAPVRQSDDSMWNHRVTGGTINIGEDTAKISKLRGNTIVWNQLIVDSLLPYNNNSITITKNGVSDYICTTSATGEVSGLSYAVVLDTNIPLIQGHKVYSHVESSLDSFRLYGNNIGSINMNNVQSLIVTIDSTVTYEGFVIIPVSTFEGSYTIKNIMIFDLTKMFGEGNEPATVEEFEAMFPNSYYEYNKGELLSLNPDGIKSVGFNQWDEEWEEGSYDASGNKITYAGRLRSKNFISVLGNTEYSFTNSFACWINEYDTNKVFISRQYISGQQVTFQTNNNTKYITFFCWDVDSLVPYNHDVCINLSDPSRNGTYEPYKESTLDLSWIKSIKDSNDNQLFPYGLLSAGSVHDEVGDNYAVKRVGSVDLGSLTWTYNNTYFSAYDANLNLNGQETYNAVPTNIINAKYTPVSRVSMPSVDKGITNNGNTFIWISDSQLNSADIDSQGKIAKLSGVMLYYELATPVTVYFDKKPMTYPVDDLGTETLLPEGVDSTTGVPLSAPFNGTFEYKSNFKDTVLDLIYRVNNTRNPVKGVTNTNQTVDKLAIYDSVETVKSSNYSPSNATIVEGATDNDIILPSVESIVDYVNTKLSSALNYKGTISQWSDLPTSGQNTGDMYIAADTFTEGSTTYQAGDFFIWNGTGWDIVSGTTSVVDKNPTLTLDGRTCQVGTVDGRLLQVTTPRLDYSSPSSDGQSIAFIDSVSQTNGLIAATKKTIPTATTGVNGVNYDILVPPSTSLWSPIYAPTTVGTDGQFLKSNGIGAPTWTDLSLSDISLYSKKLSYKLNSSTATELGTIIRNADNDLTLPEFYAPTTAGNQYDLLMSNGSGAPSWLNFGNSNGYLKKTSSGWSLIGDSDLFFPNEDVWFYPSLPPGVSALDIAATGARPSTIDLDFFGGDGIILKKVVNASQNVLGVQINTSPIVSTLQTLSTDSDSTGYLKKTAANTWELDPYGGSSNSSTDAAGNQMPFYDSSVTGSTMAGLKSTTSTGTTYQKISFAAITNDTATGNNAVTIILNGNFS